jgi:hypothetical protein
VSPGFQPFPVRTGGGDNLADILERVLDTGIVVAGDIQVNLLDIELLTIKIRLLICSADKADGLGMGWWRQDPFYTGQPALNGDVAARLGRIEAALGLPDSEEE